MTTYPRTRTFTLVLLAGACVAACGDDRSTPTRPTPPESGAPPSASVARILIKVPASIAPEQSVQLTATAIYADGTTENVTPGTQWSSADPSAVHADLGGRVTGLKVGETGVTAAYQSSTATHYGAASVVVLVPGTYKLSGRITDHGIAVAQASVTVVGGSGVDLRALTGLDGAFAVYGVAGHVQLRASREGYSTVTMEFDVTQTMSRDVEMVADRARLDLTGTYTLVLKLGACDGRAQGLFDNAFASRQYNAIVTQTGPQLVLSLSGADFITRNGKGDHFSGAVDPTGNVTFAIGNPDDAYLNEYPDLVERVSETYAFLAYGTVKARATPTTVIGAVTGAFVVAPANNPSFWERSAWCYSDRHTFEMRRQ